MPMDIGRETPEADKSLEEYLKALDIEDDIVFYPEQILDHLFSQIALPTSRHSKRYDHFITEGGTELKSMLQQCLRPEISEICNSSNRRSSIGRISLMDGDIQSHGRAIYLHIVCLPDNKLYWYIGQAHNLSFRVNAQHRSFRYRRDNPSLHNYAVDRSIWDRFVVLATLKQATSQPDLVLNLLEMWCCLLFRSLPLDALEEWAGKTEEGDFDVPSLNVALPLDNGDGKASKRAIEWLKDAQDPLAREYYEDVKRNRLRPRPAILRRANLTKSTPLTGQLSRYFETDILFGMAIGVFGTAGFFWMRRFVAKPLWQSFRRN